MLAVANVLGLLLASFSASCLLPLACSLWFRDGQWSSFLITAAIGAGCGALLAGATFPFRRELKPRDGFLLVTLAWLLLPAVAALPLLLGIPGLTVTGAFFEAMSGLTTTGSTVLNGLDTLRAVAEFLAPPARVDGRPRHHRHGARGDAAARRWRHAALQGTGARLEG